MDSGGPLLLRLLSRSHHRPGGIAGEQCDRNRKWALMETLSGYSSIQIANIKISI